MPMVLAPMRSELALAECVLEPQPVRNNCFEKGTPARLEEFREQTLVRLDRAVQSITLTGSRRYLRRPFIGLICFLNGIFQ